MILKLLRYQKKCDNEEKVKAKAQLAEKKPDSAIRKNEVTDGANKQGGANSEKQEEKEEFQKSWTRKKQKSQGFVKRR